MDDIEQFKREEYEKAENDLNREYNNKIDQADYLRSGKETELLSKKAAIDEKKALISEIAELKITLEKEKREGMIKINDEDR